MTETHHRRVLVIANETCPSSDLCARVREVAGDGAQVRVIAPALNTRLGWLTSDDEKARAAAEERVGRSLANLRAVGLEAEGPLATRIRCWRSRTRWRPSLRTRS